MSLSSWGSINYRPSAPLLYEVASHVKQLPFRPLLLLLLWSVIFSDNVILKWKEARRCSFQAGKRNNGKSGSPMSAAHWRYKKKHCYHVYTQWNICPTSSPSILCCRHDRMHCRCCVIPNWPKCLAFRQVSQDFKLSHINRKLGQQLR